MNSTTKEVIRLAVVLSHPTQYYSPWFRWVNEHSSIKLRVFYLWDFGVTSQHDPQFGTELKWDVDLLSGYDSEFVPNTAAKPGAEHFFGFRNPSITTRLKAWSPDAVLLFGYKWATHLRVLAWAKFSGIPVIFRGDSHLIGRARPKPHVRIALRCLYAQVAAFLSVGEANREYFETFGVPRERILFGPHSVNGTLFDPNDPKHRLASGALRSQLGLKESERVILFAGKLVPSKQPLELLKAFLAAKIPNTALVFVGDGSERRKLEELAGNGSGFPVRFLPFANQTEMPSRYLLADLFVLPSRGHYETWGLAVNEAMHMGVPCLVSDRVGCQRDLVTDGETGWVFQCADEGALTASLSRAITDLETPARRDAIRSAVEKRIRRYTYAETTQGLEAALYYALGQS